MRFVAVLCWLLTLVAQPAWAATSPRLQPVEQQLASLVAGAPANVGIAALDLRTGEMVSINGDQAFPMASTVKVAIAANFLAQVEHGRRALTDVIGGKSAAELLEAMLTHSDNQATDLILKNLGGPRTVQAWMTQVGVAGMRIDRTIAQLLSDKRDLYDIRDSATPAAMVDLLWRIDTGRVLMPSSRSYLLGLMSHCATGSNRIRGLLPPGTPVENKTGTLSGLTGDVGFITLPDNTRIAIAIFARGGTDRPRTIAQVARTIYDGFAYALSRPFTAAFGTSYGFPAASAQAR
jgi:beta-lactamase class A